MKKKCNMFLGILIGFLVKLCFLTLLLQIQILKVSK